MMAYQYRHNPDMFNLFDVDEYVDLMVDFVSHLRPDIVIERFTSESPADLLIAPKWGGIKNFAVATKIEQALIASNNWQGKSYQNSALQ
jgi:radical SAM superfamily enzyme